MVSTQGQGPRSININVFTVILTTRFSNVHVLRTTILDVVHIFYGCHSNRNVTVNKIIKKGGKHIQNLGVANIFMVHHVPILHLGFVGLKVKRHWTWLNKMPFFSHNFSRACPMEICLEGYPNPYESVRQFGWNGVGHGHFVAVTWL